MEPYDPAKLLAAEEESQVGLMSSIGAGIVTGLI